MVRFLNDKIIILGVVEGRGVLFRMFLFFGGGGGGGGGG